MKSALNYSSSVNSHIIISNQCGFTQFDVGTRVKISSWFNYGCRMVITLPVISRKSHPLHVLWLCIPCLQMLLLVRKLGCQPLLLLFALLTTSSESRDKLLTFGSEGLKAKLDVSCRFIQFPPKNPVQLTWKYLGMSHCLCSASVFQLKLHLLYVQWTKLFFATKVW